MKSAIINIWVFLANFLHEITLYAINIDKKGFITFFLHSRTTLKIGPSLDTTFYNIEDLVLYFTFTTVSPVIGSRWSRNLDEVIYAFLYASKDFLWGEQKIFWRDTEEILALKEYFFGEVSKKVFFAAFWDFGWGNPGIALEEYFFGETYKNVFDEIV